MPDPMIGDELRAVLTGEHPTLARYRRTFGRVPASPRCQLCAAPFAGPGGAVLRHFGFGRFAGNRQRHDPPRLFRRGWRAARQHPGRRGDEATRRRAERRSLDIRGRQEPVEVVALRA
ncbi:MAG: hypothetical protein H0V74_05210 [Chloroflexi bacterium]|nr:hypothetical protein [Chloroflexota bacterium]